MNGCKGDLSVKKSLDVAVAILVVLLAGCAETKQICAVDTSGFLDDYSILREGKEGEAARVYSNPNADWSIYNKMLLDPITIWRPPQTNLEARENAEDLERLATFFYHGLHRNLSEDYEIVDKPQAGTLRIRVGITSVEESWAMFDVITTLPGARLLSRGQEYATSKPLFTGGASVEFKVTDAQTGQLLRAGVDRRVGGKTLDSRSFDNWSDAEAAMECWAKQAKWRFCRLREGANCLPPE